MILETIHSPDDVKALDKQDLPVLCRELREFPAEENDCDKENHRCAEEKTLCSQSKARRRCQGGARCGCPRQGRYNPRSRRCRTADPAR